MAEPIVYLNGAFMPAAQARISPFDRGFLFGDGVYEVMRFFGGKPWGMDLHLARLKRSAAAVGIERFDAEEFVQVMPELLVRNDLTDASVYWQVTRGQAPGRAHLPPPDLVPTVFACADRTPGADECDHPTVVSAALLADIRWRRCDIKSINLLPNIMRKLEARDLGANEVIFHRSHYITEGGATNVFVVTADGEIVTPPDDDPEASILHGITRHILITDPSLGVRRRAIHIDELRTAREIVLTGTRTLAAAVGSLDGQPVGDAQDSASTPRMGCGPIARRINQALLADIARLRESNG